ncbi:MAG: CvpA family protein [Hyphomicrobiaceae bacterium]|nr:CvpA family protein [Hyphomicrobiaceae bacterium]
MIGPLSYLDLAFLTMGLISALLAMYRGLTRELLSIVSWIVAAGVAYFAFKRAQESVGAEIGKQIGIAGNNGALVGAAIIALAVFLVVLIVVHLLTTRVSDAILDTSVGMVDRILGFLFGFARGALIVIIGYMLVDGIAPGYVQQFAWVKQSKTLPYIQGPGNWIKGVLTQNVVPLIDKKAGDTPG